MGGWGGGGTTPKKPQNQTTGVSYTNRRSAVKHSHAGSHQRPRHRSELPVVTEPAASFMAGSTVVDVMWVEMTVAPSFSGHLAPMMNFIISRYWRWHIVLYGYALSGSRRLEASSGLLACTTKKNISMDRESCCAEEKQTVQTNLQGCEAPRPSSSALEQCGMDWIKAYPMLGLEEDPGARPRPSCCTLCYVASEGARLCGWWGTPQPCDQHQACSAVDQTLSGFSSLSDDQRWVVTACAGSAWPQCREQEWGRVSLSHLWCQGPSPPCPSPCRSLQESGPLSEGEHGDKQKVFWEEQDQQTDSSSCKISVSRLAGVKCFLVEVLQLKSRWWLCAMV